MIAVDGFAEFAVLPLSWLVQKAESVGGAAFSHIHRQGVVKIVKT